MLALRAGFSARSGALSAPEDDAPYLDYAVRWRAGQALPGRHTSRVSGAGGHFRAYRPFWQVPDARKIDVRRSIVDPFDEVMVRQTDDRTSISVVVAADVSRSMQASPSGILRAVTRLAEAAARSAHRAGDAFGLIGFDAVPREDLYLPPCRSRGASGAALAALRDLHPDGCSADGIAHLAPLLPVRRCLVILASDFLVPFTLLEQALAALATHDVAPVVFHEPAERQLPRAGLMRLRDSETGEQRLCVMRPALARRWQAARDDWRARLDALFLRHCRPGFHVEGRLDVARLGEHLLAC
jgi:uncharacterized protein (DUF58 family)